MKQKHLAAVLFVALSLIWGSSFILIKKGVQDMPPLIFATLRVGLTGLLFLPLVIKHRKRIDWPKWPFLMGVGYLGSLIPFTLFAIAQTQVPSAIAGMINTLTPIFTLIIGVFLFKNKTLKHQFFGAFLGLFGAIILITSRSSAIGSFPVYYGVFMIFATMCYGTNINIVNSKLHAMKTIDITSVSFVMAAIPCFFYLALPSNRAFLSQVDVLGVSMVATLMIVVLGTFIATLIFFKIVKLTNAMFASLTAYLIPIVAVLCGGIDGEHLKIMYAVGITFILLGAYLAKQQQLNVKLISHLRLRFRSKPKRYL